MQAFKLSLIALTYQIQNGAFEHPLYQGFFRSSLSANPFEIVGLVSALVLSLTYLAMERWQVSIKSFPPRKEILDDLT